MHIRLIPLLFILVLAGRLDAQSPGSAPGETMEVTLVEVPVNVIDRSGNPIRGLKAKNFQVLDDGEERPISHFEEVDLATISAGHPYQVVSPAARRNFLVVFDLSNSSPRSILRARDAAETFLVETLQPRDLGAVATYSVEEGFRLLTAFTTDRVLLGYAVRTLGNSRFYETRDPLLLSGMLETGMTSNPQLYSPNEIEYNILEGVELIQQQAERLNDANRRSRIQRQFESFGSFARLLDSVKGRKQVILLSEGFDASLVHGQEDLGSLKSQQDSSASVRGEIWRIDNDDRFGNVGATGGLANMAQLFRRSDVVLHSIDLKGLASSSDARKGSDRRRSDDALFLMSEPTGGEVFRNANDIAGSFSKLLKQQEVVYIIGFQTMADEPGKFHDLKVKVKVIDQPRLRVTHRAGYYEPRSRLSVTEQTLSATDVLMNDIPFDDVKIHTLAVPIPSAGDEIAVPVIVEISGASLLERVDGNALNGEIFIYAFDGSGSVRDFLVQTVSLDLTRIREALSGSGLKYYGTLSLPPGNYALKTLVRVAESGYNGFERIELNVPRFGEAALLPPLALEEPGKWIMLKGVSKAEGSPEYPFVVDSESFIPSAMLEMKASDTVRLALFTYHYEPEDIELVATARRSDGLRANVRLELLGRTTVNEDGEAKLLLGFTPAGLGPGDYTLDFTLREREGERSSQSSLSFRIVG